jgi:hypothetical protein
MKLLSADVPYYKHQQTAVGDNNKEQERNATTRASADNLTGYWKLLTLQGH